GKRVQFLPVAAVIRSKLRADRGQLCFEFAYIRLQCLHTARQTAAFALPVLVGLTGHGGGGGCLRGRLRRGGRLGALRLVGPLPPVAVVADVRLQPVTVDDQQAVADAVQEVTVVADDDQ